MSDRITFTLHEVISAMDAHADAVLRARYGVTFNHFQFLAILADVEPSDMTTLAACLGITKAGVSKRVPALVADGWIASEPGAGRSILLSLTAKGAALVRDAGGVLEREFTELLADPALAADPIDVPRLNRQLVALTTLVQQQQEQP
ncbi:MarR family winged helix-turn-helix transcriptional regulator [Microbacterium sp. CFBP9034]|uniref:MarR family winged helix-turn-helix transcriptional regulator n=1 Tax=Microbacterium sp. CFBP9034 TaxID=3096540 RepID=UPI002A6A6AEE|nr:MarR family transcriptional regulator [Microbacterium sp. CFBP9034]MDY0910567.1 MarR family transcriptional regulator [Microbacterium sp. CFBP9034]